MLQLPFSVSVHCRPAVAIVVASEEQIVVQDDLDALIPLMAADSTWLATDLGNLRLGL